jgi:hypothetical protein
MARCMTTGSVMGSTGIDAPVPTSVLLANVSLTATKPVMVSFSAKPVMAMPPRPLARQSPPPRPTADSELPNAAPAE